jgi:hypothetical protein
MMRRHAPRVKTKRLDTGPVILSDLAADLPPDSLRYLARHAYHRDWWGRPVLPGGEAAVADLLALRELERRAGV